MWRSVTDEVIEDLNRSVMSETEFFALEIEEWKKSEKRRKMIDGERYFRGEHDILKEVRSAIGSNGKLKKLSNLPNNHIVDNQYQRLVNQKVNYLLGREILLDGDNDEYVKLFKKALGRDFTRRLKCLMRDAVNMGIAWLYAYTDEEDRLCFKRIPAYEMIAYWKDEEHTVLDKAVRIYFVEGYRDGELCRDEMVEIYSENKVEIFSYDGGRLVKKGEMGYFRDRGIPLIAFKYNEKETGLIERVKSLQDALNKTISDFENRLQEDSRNTILVLQNYDGTDLGEFRENLAQYGAVKVKTVDGAPGDIRTLSVEFDAENYSCMINLLKDSIIENGMGYNPKKGNLGNSPNQLVIKAMFSDMDLDMSEAEIEFRYAFNTLRQIIDEYFVLSGRGYFEGDRLDIIFNKDVLINESEAIDNCIKSRELLSEETCVREHPWVGDVMREMKKRRCE